MSWPLALMVSAGLLLANAFFVGAEFALLASRRSRLEQLADAGERRARAAIASLRRLSLMLAGAQLGITMASLGLGAVAEPTFDHLLRDTFDAVGLPEGASHVLAFGLGLSIVVLLHMVVGEMAPKSWAIAAPERAALVLVRPFSTYVWVLRPFIRGLNASANLVVRLVGVTPQDERAMVHTAGDLALLLSESIQEGTLDHADVQVLSRVLELSGLDAASAMTPRSAVAAVAATATVDQIERMAVTTGHRRLLVHGVGLDEPVGVVHVRDVLLLDGAARASATAGGLARPILVTDEGRHLEDLLLAMQRERNGFAAVVDAEHRLAGIVTMQDVTEALVGRSAE